MWRYWNYLITLITVYVQVTAPLLYVFPELNENLGQTEYLIDVVFLISILMKFFTKTKFHRNLKDIAKNYLFTYFIFDFLSTIPPLFFAD